MSKSGSIAGVAGIAALVVVAGVVAAVGGRGGDVWLGVEERDFVVGIPTEGELRSVNSALIGPPSVEGIWNFQISMMAPEGSEVQPGQPVLGFDTTELQQRLRQSTADADAAEKELEKATTDLDVQRRQLELRLEEAAARHRRAALEAGASAEVVAATELEKARIDRRLAEIEIASLRSSLEQHRIRQRLDLASLESQLAHARSQVAQLSDSIERMKVVAPRAGTITMKTDWRHQKKQVGDQVWRAETVLEIPDLSAMEAAAEVDEAAAGRLETGQTVTFRLDAYPDHEYRGRVSQIRRAVQKKSRESPAKIVKLTLTLETTDTERMRPGMRFRGTIAAETSPATLTVPIAAVFSSRDGPYVWRKTTLGSSQIYPELGRHNREYVEILSGLMEGDRVLRRDLEAAAES